jgi:hypothetical protein
MLRIRIQTKWVTVLEADVIVPLKRKKEETGLISDPE